MQINEFYNFEPVRARIGEFLGYERPGKTSCYFLATSKDAKSPEFIVKPACELDYYLKVQKDFSRSLFDRRGLIIDLDTEYVNFDYPAEPYLDRERTFEIQQTTASSLTEKLGKYMINPLHIMTGRGHHFVWQVIKNTSAFNELVKIGELDRMSKSNLSALNIAPPVDIQTTKAYIGVGMLMEYLCNFIKLSVDSVVPIQLTEVCPPPQQRGREIISLDISEYGDPLITRVLRIPFSIYLKPYWNNCVYNEQTRQYLPLTVVIPYKHLHTEELIKISQNLQLSAEFAKATSTWIPDFSSEMPKLIEEYNCSPLRKFHEFFYEMSCENELESVGNYEGLKLENLSPCVRHIIENPNPFMMKPSSIRLLTITLLGIGWHPRQIAGFIRKKYERDYGWLNEWLVYDAAKRADFYTRIFAGQIALKTDTLAEINQSDIASAGLCFNNCESCRIERLRDRCLQKCHIEI